MKLFRALPPSSLFCLLSLLCATSLIKPAAAPLEESNAKQKFNQFIIQKHNPDHRPPMMLDQHEKELLSSIYTIYRKDFSEKVAQLKQEETSESLQDFVVTDIYTLSLQKKPFSPQEISFIKTLCEDFISPTINIAPPLKGLASKKGSDPRTLLRAVLESDNAQEAIDREQPGAEPNPHHYAFKHLLKISAEEAHHKGKSLTKKLKLLSVEPAWLSKTT